VKVINNWLRTGTAFYSSTLSGGYKNQCKEIWTFSWSFRLWNKSVFSTVNNQFYFLLSLAC